MFGIDGDIVDEIGDIVFGLFECVGMWCGGWIEGGVVG